VRFLETCLAIILIASIGLLLGITGVRRVLLTEVTYYSLIEHISFVSSAVSLWAIQLCPHFYNHYDFPFWTITVHSTAHSLTQLKHYCAQHSTFCHTVEPLLCTAQQILAHSWTITVHSTAHSLTQFKRFIFPFIDKILGNLCNSNLALRKTPFHFLENCRGTLEFYGVIILSALVCCIMVMFINHSMIL
jgi:hypothetical protein